MRQPAIPMPGPACARWSSSAPIPCPTSPIAGWPNGPSATPPSWSRWPRRPAPVTERADVVLPAAEAHERPGTTTNIEGRVSRLGQKLVPPGQAWPDWMIAAELAVHLGADLGLDSVGEVWDEIERLAPAYRGITRAVLDALGTADGVVAPLAASAVSIGAARAPCSTRSPSPASSRSNGRGRHPGPAWPSRPPPASASCPEDTPDAGGEPARPRRRPSPSTSRSPT